MLAVVRDPEYSCSVKFSIKEELEKVIISRRTSFNLRIFLQLDLTRAESRL